MDLETLDVTLVERLSVPMKLLVDDYVNIAGSHGTAAEDPACDLNYRLFATSWIGPWGSILPWSLPPSSVEKLDSEGSSRIRVTLRLPQSRVRHFLTDASLHIKSEVASNPRITKAVLRLGPDRIIQFLDSEFACRVSWKYKCPAPSSSAISYDLSDKSHTITSPLFFDLPLRVLPLFVPNMPLPEIEYELTGVADDSTITFLTEFVTSPGEVELIPQVDLGSKVVIQHLPSLSTFKSAIVDGSQEVSVSVGSNSGKLVRALYFRVYSNTSADLASVVESVDLLSPPPASRSLIGNPIAGSVCRTHLKRRFSKNVEDLPYYVIPFAVTPGGNTADYGIVLSEGSTLKVVLTHTDSPVVVEVCVETFERVVWKR